MDNTVPVAFSPQTTYQYPGTEQKSDGFEAINARKLKKKSTSTFCKLRAPRSLSRTINAGVAWVIVMID